MVAVKQVPGKRDCHSSQRATDGCKGQHLGSHEVRDKIPVDIGKAGMSRRGDGAVTGRARSGVPSLGCSSHLQVQQPPP